jgi:septum formation protein
VITCPTEPQKQQFILASNSPRRQELLKILGLSFIVLPPVTQLINERDAGVDETPLPGETPSTLVQRLSRLKAEAVAANLSSPAPMLPISEIGQIIIIAADTEVALADKILGKPGNAAEAIQMLQLLRRQSHQVYSGLTVALLSGQKSRFITRLHQSTVWMRPYTNAEIAAYVASGDPLDKAGAYGIQNRAFAPVERLDGCFASVMGLPLGELAAAFREIGLLLPEIGLLCTGYTGYPCCQHNR